MSAMAHISRRFALSHQASAADTRGPCDARAIRHGARPRISRRPCVKTFGIASMLLAAVSAAAQVHAGTGVWTEQETTATDATGGTQFGSAASLDGSLALIGADGGPGARGAAYFFSTSDGTWSQLQKITPEDAASGDEFGYRVKLRDDLAIVTSFSATVAGRTAQGAAYLFAPNAGTWAQAQKLVADDGGVFDNFGASIALDGTNLAIGANGATVGSNAAQGAAYVFTSDGTTWSQTQKVIADDGQAFDNYGVAAAMAGDTLFVSAPTAPVDGNNGEGAVYAYKFDGGTWTQTQKIVGSNGAAFMGFGFALAFDGTTLMVGATGSGGSGAVYVFTNEADTWTEQQRVIADDLGSGDNFGNAISIHGSSALIGADIQTVDSNTSRGAAYLFNYDGASWTQGHKFTASDGTTDDFFGLAVDYDGGTALISTLHPNANAGAAYFYTNDVLFANGFD
jgi:hypothetical protein